MKRRIFQCLAWLLVLLWMGLIFSFSGQTAEVSSEISSSTTAKIIAQIYPGFNSLSPDEQAEIIDTAELFVRKAGHLIEYFILSALLVFALLFNNFKPINRAILAILISLIYAATDEIHQLFVSGRACRLSDVLIDTCGAAIFAVLYLLAIKIFNRKEKNPPA
ncbi:MAG: VanZ family protein [Clostridia bacterium]|nr:VanZ family protein [Clostridia bacterium]